jgi:hypothetical protein
MTKNQIAPVKTPDPPHIANVPSEPSKWQTGKTLRFVFIICGLFWAALTAGLWAYLRTR